MNFLDLVKDFLADTVDVSLPSFLPELILTATIVVMLLLRIVSGNRVTERISAFLAAWLPLVGALLALAATRPWLALGDHSPADANLGGGIFTGMLVYDNLTIYFRALLLFFVVCFVVFTQLSGIPDREDAADFYTLILGATIGMCLMASANHLLIVFLGVEMASVPSYALAGMLKGRRQASEAALKYAVYGAGAAGVMLYGISLLAGVVGTCHLPTIAARLAEMLEAGTFADRYLVLVLAGLMITVGLAFKLSAVPFHFWCPDVFEGASAEVNAFLSVASKAAALALLVRVSIGVGYVHEALLPNTAPEAQAAAAESGHAMLSLVAMGGRDKAAGVAPESSNPVHISGAALRSAPATPAHALGESANRKIQTVSLRQAQVPAPPEAAADAAAPTPVPAGAKPLAEAAPIEKPSIAKLNAALAPVRSYIVLLVSLLAAVTCTFGNLAAYGQTNIKRLLAYSTIAHAGYLMMPVAAAISLVGRDRLLAENAISGMAFYIATYLFMNLGAFAIVAFLRNAMQSEEIADYAGLIRSCPGVTICLAVIMLSLLGLPPLVGFIAKVAIFYPLVAAGQYTLLVIGGLNTVLSLFYYLRVVKVMTLDPEPADRLPVSLPLISLPGVYIVAISLPVVILGLANNSLFQWATAAAAQLL